MVLQSLIICYSCTQDERTLFPTVEVADKILQIQSDVHITIPVFSIHDIRALSLSSMFTVAVNRVLYTNPHAKNSSVAQIVKIQSPMNTLEQIKKR